MWACSSIAIAAKGAEKLGPYQFDNTVYALPGDAWRRGRTSADSVLLYADKAPGVRIHVLRGSPLGTDNVSAWLGKRMAAFTAAENEREIKSDRLAIVKHEAKAAKLGAADVVIRSEQLKDPDARGKRVMRIGVGRRVKAARPVVAPSAGTQPAPGTQPTDRAGTAGGGADRGECVVFEATVRAGDKPDELKAHTAAFTRFAAAVRFVSDGSAPPVIGPPTPGELDGIYCASTVVYDVGGLRADTRYVVFGKTGRFYDGLPAGQPLRPFDFDRAVAAEPADAGNYVVAGNKLKLMYADGKTDESDFARTGKGSLKAMGGTYVPTEPARDGLRLAGTFTSFNYSAFAPGSGVSGGVASSRSYAFAADGRFTAGRFTGVSASFENAAGDTTGGVSGKSAPPDQRGRYAVKAGLLTLTADDGTVTRKSIVADGDAPGLLVLDGSAYLRKSPDLKAKAGS